MSHAFEIAVARAAELPKPRIRRHEQGNFCDREGAEELKRRIEEYWTARGAQVDVKLKEAAFTAPLRSARVDIRSDLLNGFPTRRAP